MGLSPTREFSHATLGHQAVEPALPAPGCHLEAAGWITRNSGPGDEVRGFLQGPGAVPGDRDPAAGNGWWIKLRRCRRTIGAEETPGDGGQVCGRGRVTLLSPGHLRIIAASTLFVE